MAVFNKTFNRTFRGPSVPGVSVVSPDAPCGITLQWLTSLGWHFWTFEAYRDTPVAVSAVGSFVQNNLAIDTQKKTQSGYVVRTSELSEANSQFVAGLLSSIAVYWLRDDDGSFEPARVRVETTELMVWKQSYSQAEHAIRITLPTIKSLRR